MERSEKLARFESTIQKEVAQKCTEIDRELEAYRNRELSRAEDTVLEESYRLIQKEVAEISAQMTREVSRKRVELRHRLYAHRDECVAEIFAQARQRLAEFSAGPEYRVFLLEKARLLGENGADGTVLRVRPQDMALEPELVTAYGHACTVQAAPELTLGGIVAENAVQKSIADESLDALLEAQRAWLCNQADFVVSI